MNKDFITIKVDRTRYKKIFIKDILYFKADRIYSTIKTFEDEYLLTTHLMNLELILNSEVFIRINRSYIANINNCIELKVGNNPELILSNKEVIKPSKQHLCNLEKLFCTQTLN